MSPKTPRDDFDFLDFDDEDFSSPPGGEPEDRRSSFSLDELLSDMGLDMDEPEPEKRPEPEDYPEEEYPEEEYPESGKYPALEAYSGQEEYPEQEEYPDQEEYPEQEEYLDQEEYPEPVRRGPPPEPAYEGRAAPHLGRELRSDQLLIYDSELDEVDYTDEEDMPELRDYMPVRFRRYGRIGIGGGLLYALFIISVSIVLACLGWMYASDVLALNKEDHSAVVVINEYEPEEGQPAVSVVNDQELPIKVDIDQVATALKNAGIIEYKWLFKLYSRFSHAETKIDPGTYDISTELDYRAIVTALRFGSGNQEITRVTFPEGYTMEQVFALLEENNICKEVNLNETAADYEFDYDFLDPESLGDARRLEGYLFPDTYDFYQGEDASVAINRFLRNLDNKLTDEIKNAAANRGLSVHELLTVASLIEKEAGSDAERATIASVIYNRLNAGWTLSLDSTINYILGTSTFALSQADLEIDDPYNTYLYPGLPPGPICNPGLASIEAAVNPENTDYWFWYAYEGETHFFTNADDFNAFADEHPYS